MRLRESIELIKITSKVEQDYLNKILKTLKEEQERTGLGFIQYKRITELLEGIK